MTRLDDIPVWATPHRFAYVSLKGGREPRDLFTYGPLAEDASRVMHDLAGKDALKALQRANVLLGLEWVASVDGHYDSPVKSSALRVALEDTYALKPGDNHGWNKLGERGDEAPPAISESVLREFTSEVGRFAAQLFTRLDPYVNELGVAADKRRAMGAVDPTALLDEIDVAGIPHMPKEFTNARGELLGVGLVTRRLDHRVCLELLDLLVHETVVARCPACKRIFVPTRKGQRYCRRYTWDASTHADVVRGCVSDTRAREILAAESAGPDYRTEYLRLSQHIARLKKRFGEDHPDVKLAKQARDEWKAKAGQSERGRPVKPLPSQPAPPRLG